MSVTVEIKNGDETVNYGDVDGREYRYEIGEHNGVLSIYSKEAGGRLVRDPVPDVVYGPGAWHSVTGDPRTRADAPKSRMVAS